MRNNQDRFQTIAAKRSSCVRNLEKTNRLNDHFRRSRITLLLCSLVLMAFCFLLIDGCSKNNGPTAPSAPSMLQGNPAFHASAVAEYQSLGAGVSYPFVGLKLASPTGSTIHSLSVANPLSHSHGSMALRRISHLTSPLEFVPALNLYTDGGSFNGNVATVKYYSDSAGTQSAGTFTITLPTNITNPSDPTSFASYPAVGAIVVNLTGGNLPCKGNVQLTFTGGTGANSMTGTMTLTKDNVVFNLNLALSDQLDVSGSITITESGATLQATNVQGSLTGTLTCNVTESPYGWTGTGTLNLLTGSMTVNLNTGTGASTAASDNLGNLNIKYADGTQEAVNNALSGGLTGGVTPVGGSTTSYNAPLIYTNNQRIIVAINNKGQSIGYIGAAGVPLYWASPTAQPETLQVPVGNTYDVALGLNDKGQIVGTGTLNSGYAVNPLYWSSPTAQPQILAVPSNAANFNTYGQSINNSGQIVGWAQLPGITLDNIGIYWASPIAQPQELQPLTGYSGVSTIFISPGGQIIGNAYGSGANGINGSLQAFWASSTAQPFALNPLTGDEFSNAMSVNAVGLIVGASYNGVSPHPATWAGDNAPAQALSLLSSSLAYGYASSINSSGVIVGLLSTSDGYLSYGVLWKNGKAQDLNTLIPSGNNSWTLGAASLITDQGWILGTVIGYGKPAQYILIPK